MLQRALNWSGRTAAGAYAGSLLQMDVRWHQPLPTGAKIVAANHPTTTDAFILMGLIPERMSILIKEACFKIPALGLFLRGAGHVPVLNGNGRLALLHGQRLLGGGRTVGIFPEGVLSPLTGGVGPLRTGVARLALSTGAPVVPVGIALRRENIRFVSGQIDGLPEVVRWYLHGPYCVTVGVPMRFVGDAEDREQVHTVLARIAQRIAQLSQESARRVRPAQTPTGSVALSPGAVGA